MLEIDVRVPSSVILDVAHEAKHYGVRRSVLPPQLELSSAYQAAVLVPLLLDRFVALTGMLLHRSNAS